MRYKLTLDSVVDEASDVKSFHFTPETPIDYIPGQFLKYFLSHPHQDERGVSRYFTISSAPSEKTIMISTKFVPGDGSTFKQSLLKLNPGDPIEAEGPSGKFIYDDPTKEAVFIAGGIGITPFRSILVELDHQDINAPITLLYANKTEDIPFKELFDKFAAKHDKLKINYVTGLITQEILNSLIVNHQSSVFYLSGPEPMVESLKKQLQELGLPSEAVKTDYFPGYEDEYTLTK